MQLDEVLSKNSPVESKKHFFDIRSRKKFLWVKKEVLLILRKLLDFEQMLLINLKKTYANKKSD